MLKASNKKEVDTIREETFQISGDAISEIGVFNEKNKPILIEKIIKSKKGTSRN